MSLHEALRGLSILVKSRTGRIISLGLEVQELQIVRALVPLVLLIVIARSRLALVLLVNVEPLSNSEMQIIRHETACDTGCLQALCAVEQAS